MTLLYAIIFPIIFPIMTHGTIIFPIIFPIMTHYFSLFFLLFSIMTGCWHTENGNVQTAIIDPIIEEWLINVNEECQLNCIDWNTCIMNWKQPDAELQDYYTHYLCYYAHYFSWRTRIAVAVSTSYALPMYVHRFCVLQYAYGTSWMLPLLSEVPKLFCLFAIILHYITIIAIIFSIICIISNIKVAFWVGIHCKLQANSISEHGGTLFEASSSGVDSILDHKGAFSHHRAVIDRAVHWLRTTDV